jgi:catalase
MFIHKHSALSDAHAHIAALPLPHNEPSPRKVAILVGNGSDGPMVRAIYKALLDDGAVPRLVGSRLGKIHANDKSVLYIEITLEAGPLVLYDALVVPDGEAAIASLVHDAQALDFVRAQYLQRKPIMVMGAGAHLLRQASVPPPLPADGDGLAPALAAFKRALSSQRGAPLM